MKIKSNALKTVQSAVVYVKTSFFANTVVLASNFPLVNVLHIAVLSQAVLFATRQAPA